MPRIREFLIQEKTRHGKTRFLFNRHPGGSRITIKGQPGQAEFEARYQELLRGDDHQIELEKASIERQRRHAAPHTVAELGRHYR